MNDLIQILRPNLKNLNRGLNLRRGSNLLNSDSDDFNVNVNDLTHFPNNFILNDVDLT